MNVRNLEVDQEAKAKREEAAQRRQKDSTAYYNASNENPNSIAAKANMVKKFDERNSKKK